MVGAGSGYATPTESDMQREIESITTTPSQIRSRMGDLTTADDDEDLLESLASEDLSNQKKQETIDEINRLTAEISGTPSPSTPVTPVKPQTPKTPEVPKTQYASGSAPLMKKEDMKKDVSDLKDRAQSKRREKYSEAADIVSTWSNSTGRGLTKGEFDALVQATMNGICNGIEDYDRVLFGFHVRGEQNVLECRNVCNAMQELLNSMIAGQKDFIIGANRTLAGFQNAAQPKLQAQPTPQIIPVTKKPPTPSAANTTGGTTTTNPEVVNKEIQKIIEGSPEALSVENFYTCLGRTAQYVKRMFKIDPEVAALGFIQETMITAPAIYNNRTETWALFTKYAKSLGKE
uniref:Protein 2 n=1 Tax=Chamaemelum virus 1 TaxID=2977963 RepID=A0A9N7AAT0_9RHAB|nr:TPA_asm: protein 2 [Chamaemelum virus 1]